VGAMVVYENGLAKNKDYRHFQIRDLPQNGSLAKPDDFLSLAEVLRRRLKYCVKLKKQLKLKKINGGFELVNQDNKKILATINLSPVSDLIATLDFDFVDKADFIPVLKAIITRSKFKKYYLAIALEKFSPVPFADFNMQIDRTDSSRYVLETSKFSLVDQSLNSVPDLIVIDGGKGQLSAVKKVVKEIGMNELNLCSLAKKKEEIFLPNKPSSIILVDHSPEKFLLTQIRDETHRFAITHNRKRRDAKITESSLDQIPGIGEKTKMKLIKHFGTVAAVLQADLNELAMVANIKVAKAIKKV
jgi:excinuclease UvrABC nuclease subunit